MVHRRGMKGVAPMPRLRHMAVLALFAVTALSLLAQTPLFAHGVLAQAPAPSVLAVPDAVAVSPDASSTAFLAIDFLAPTCTQNSSCVAALPAAEAGLSAARAANVLVVYSVHAAPDNNILADVAPMPGDPVFVAAPGDKFFNSNLDDILKQAGINTLVITGWSSNIGVLYTAAAATQR